MPRSGWLALGAVVAALAATQPWVGRAWLAEPMAWGVAGASWLAILWAWRSGRRGPRGSAGLSRLAPVIIVGAGSLLIGARLTAFPLPADSGPLELPDGSGPWTASVESIGSPRGGLQVATVTLAEPPRLRIAITAPAYPRLTVGGVVRLGGSLEAIPDDDYGHFLSESGVDATLRARSLEIENVPPSASALIDGLRRSAADGLSLALPEPEAGLAAGILIGLRDRVDRDLAKAFTAAGVSHVVAISGWNIAIVAATVGALLRGLSRRRRSIASLLVIAVYTVLTGASPSVMRAAVMATSVTLARESGRAGGAAAALGWAATAMIAADPAVVGDPGFQLSSLATAGLITWATPLTERLAAWRGGRLPGWLAESLGVSLAAEAATLPLVLLVFGRLAILAPLVNLAVVPLVAPAMATGAVALVAGGTALAGLPSELAALVSLPGWACLTGIVWVVRLAASLPFASVVLEPPANLLAAGASAGVVVLLASTRARDLVHRAVTKVVAPRRPARSPSLTRPPGPEAALGAGKSAPRSTGVALRRLGLSSAKLPRLPDLRRADRATRLVALAVAASVLGLVLVAAHRADRQVRVDVLDVGQGDAILVEGDHGSRLLIDGGPDPGRLLSVLDARLPPWDRRIDLLILSHPHEDHVAGLPKLLESYRIRTIAEPGMIGPGPGYRAFASWLFGHGRTVQRLATGDALALDSIQFQVLWPDPGAVPLTPPDTGTGINNVSIVLLGRIGSERMLLMGDVEQGIDPILLDRVPQVDLLKVAHHGSGTASTEPFLETVRPKVAVVSAGLNNPYGHPAPATIRRLEAHEAQVYRTDRNGTVEVALEGGRWVAHPDKSAAAAAADGVEPAVFTGVSNPGAALLFRCSVPGPTTGSGLPAPPAVVPALATTPGRTSSPAAVAPANRGEPPMVSGAPQPDRPLEGELQPPRTPPTARAAARSRRPESARSPRYRKRHHRGGPHGRHERSSDGH